MGDIGHYGFDETFTRSCALTNAESSIGLQLAKLADLPEDILSEATRVTELMEEKRSAQKASSEAERIAQRRKVFLRVMITSLSPSAICGIDSSWSFAHDVALRVHLSSSGHGSLKRLNTLCYPIENCWNTSLGSRERRSPLFVILYRLEVLVTVGWFLVNHDDEKCDHSGCIPRDVRLDKGATGIAYKQN